jgi:hypothetical protein
MITKDEEDNYLEDKPYYYKLGWRNCSSNQPIRKFTLHNEKDAADHEMYNIGYGDCIANLETNIDLNFDYEGGDYMD